jgi:hypothetical protein
MEYLKTEMLTASAATAIQTLKREHAFHTTRASEAHRISVVNEIGSVARAEDIDVFGLMQSLPRAHDCLELDYAQPQEKDSIVPFNEV